MVFSMARKEKRCRLAASRGDQSMFFKDLEKMPYFRN